MQPHVLDSLIFTDRRWPCSLDPLSKGFFDCLIQFDPSHKRFYTLRISDYLGRHPTISKETAN